jgi:hypothetical protein
VYHEQSPANQQLDDAGAVVLSRHAVAASLGESASCFIFVFVTMVTPLSSHYGNEVSSGFSVCSGLL